MTAVFKGTIQKIISLSLSVFMLFGINLMPEKETPENWNTNYKYVMVHGLLGWGQYDSYNSLLPYWGMLSGDLLERLGCKGFECYAVSVSPTGSAWDRACELYAQLTGTVTDYGQAHAKAHGHMRYGTDFTGKKLFDGEWNEEEKINLVGHSFGGTTVRMFAHLLENGSEEERAVTDSENLSPFFEGGKGDLIYSVITLAAPHNGTTAYETDRESAIKETSHKLDGALSTVLNKLASAVLPKDEKTNDPTDSAGYDMKIDNALALNKKIATLENVYYFSYAAQSSYEDENGCYVPDTSKTESIFVASSEALGKTTLTTEGGYVVDEKWFANDGLVNTYSALAPFYAPSSQYDERNVSTGIWNIMPIFEGDHMSFQGGLTKVYDPTDFFTEAFCIINSL